jgi:hypothetical protein
MKAAAPKALGGDAVAAHYNTHELHARPAGAPTSQGTVQPERLQHADSPRELVKPSGTERGRPFVLDLGVTVSSDTEAQVRRGSGTH